MFLPCVADASAGENRQCKEELVLLLRLDLLQVPPKPRVADRRGDSSALPPARVRDLENLSMAKPFPGNWPHTFPGKQTLLLLPAAPDGGGSAGSPSTLPLPPRRATFGAAGAAASHVLLRPPRGIHNFSSCSDRRRRRRRRRRLAIVLSLGGG